MHNEPRPATGAIAGGVRDTVVGAASAAAYTIVLEKTGSPELASGAAAAAVGLLTFLRKVIMNALFKVKHNGS